MSAVRSATFDTMAVLATKVAYFSCSSCWTGRRKLSFRQIQGKIAGRASRGIVGEITKRARAATPVAL
jgi:hypothetical protein